MATGKTCRSRSEYRIGWICAIDPELDAAKAALDEQHPTLPNVRGDDNSYTYGRIGPHNIVIASLPSDSYGTNAAAITATQMRRSFPDLEFGLMVGIGGGVPHNPDSEDPTAIDIRLGDVVVSSPKGTSPGVIQYDLGKTIHGQSRPIRTGTLNKPPRVLLNATKLLKSRHRADSNACSRQLISITENIPLRLREKFSYQGSECDVLFEADYQHKASNLTCAECDRSRQVVRKPRESSNPMIHYGLIASGDQVVKDSLTRDYWQAEESVLCFEMEAAGLMDDFKCLVIRGICDYADSHKNKRWQEYAALAAAAYAKDLLHEIPPQDISGTPQALDQQRSPRGNTHWKVPRSSNPYFTGRQDIIETLTSAFEEGEKDIRRSKQKRFIITGFGGIGKSEICIKFAELNRDKFWGIFWVDVGDHEGDENHSDKRKTAVPTPTAAKDYRDIGRMCQADGNHFESIRAWLSNIEARWLLILDNADNPSVDYSRYVPSGNFGNIILTSRNRRCADLHTVGHEDLDTLPTELAENLLLLSSGVYEDEWSGKRTEAKDVVHLLGSHTLALIQAGSLIKEEHREIKEYPTIFQRQKAELLDSNYALIRSSYGSVFSTFEVSMNHLYQIKEQHATDALELLNMLPFMDCNNITEALFHRAFEYANKLRDKGERIIANAPKSLPHKRMSLERLFVQGKTKFRKETRNQQRILNMEDFQLELSSQSCEYLPTWMSACNDSHFNNFRWRRACGILSALSLVKIANESDDFGISIHPLTSNWLLHRQNFNQRVRSWSAVLSVLCLSTQGSQYWSPLFALICPHLSACVSLHIQQYFRALDFIVVGHLLCRVIEIWCAVGDTVDIVEALLEAIRITAQEQNMIISDPFGRLDYWTAYIHIHRSEFGEAKQLLKKILRSCRSLVPDSSLTFNISQDLAAVYEREGKISQATKLRQHCVAQSIDLRKIPPTSMTLYDTAWLKMYTGRREEARDLFKEVKEKGSFEIGDPMRYLTLINLSRMYWFLDQHTDALSTLSEVLSLDSEGLSPTNVYKLRALLLLAGIYEDLDQHQKAEDALEESNQLLDTAYDPQKEEWVMALSEFAKMCAKQGKVHVARDLLEKVVEANRKIYDKQDHYLLTSMYELAILYSELGQKQKAQNVLEEVFEAQSTTLDRTHKSLLLTMEWLAKTNHELGQLDMARSLLEEVVVIEKTTLSRDDTGRLKTLHNLARIYKDLKDYDKALKLAQEVVEIEREIEIDDVSRVTSVLLMAEIEELIAEEN